MNEKKYLNEIENRIENLLESVFEKVQVKVTVHSPMDYLYSEFFLAHEQ